MAKQASSEQEAFVSLYRRYRPGRFSELRGQEHIAQALKASVAADRVGHAYLFSGPRGTGKTTTARILAKVLNCEAPAEGEPCGVCSSCVEIVRGNSFDVTEIDAASHNGVDAMREMISSASMATPGRWRVYILDEVHMLSAGAEAAFLKTLEEPPPHVVFVLATTDPEKVKATIRSRTQHFEFRLLGSDVLAGLLDEVAAKADLGLSTEAIHDAVRRGHGSARDALSALDQIAATGGLVEERPEPLAVLSAVAERDTAALLIALASLHDAGWSPSQVAAALADNLRQAFLSAMAPSLCELPEADRAPLIALQQLLGNARLVRAMEVVGQAMIEMKNAPDQRSVLEVALVRVTHPELDDSPASLLERIERLERSPRAAAATPSASPERSMPSPAVALEPQSPEVVAAKPTVGALRRQAGASPAAAKPVAEAEAASEPVLTQATEASVEPSVAPEKPSQISAAPSPLPLPADLEEMNHLWRTEVIDNLPPRPRTLFQDAKMTGFKPGAVRFAAPNDAHRRNAEASRADVEEALSALFGQAFSVVITYKPPAAQPAAPASAPEPMEEEYVGESRIVSDAEAGDLVTNRILDAFPGASSVES